jgi:hypothetical protein
MRATTHAADPHATLRRALLLDAVATAGMPAALMRGAGAALLPFAALLAWVARRHLVPTTAARALIGANVLWAIDSLILPATGWIDATALGVVFVVGQGLVVAAFAGLEYAGLRRVTHTA